ncbi:MAG: TetR/AcrR family transcriptional regulator C-terminal domain-containing protein [Phycisphaerales bacterium]|nr:TetR/AcrR family transcriptional regulator C-terminal domain-containing protein [Phycisphaerales bacterium]
MKDLQGVTLNRTRKPRRGPGRPAAGESLTPQDVARGALNLIAAEGEQALTMRRLGEVLGVKAMALYNHYPDKEAILDAVAGLALARLPMPPAKGPWKSRIKSVCRGIRRMAMEHPNLFRVAMTRPTPPSTGMPQIESAFSALADAGLAPAAQAVAYHTLRLYVRAYCLWEIDELNRGGDLAEPARVPVLDPHHTAAVNHHLKSNPDRLFEAGLDLILRGLRAGEKV